MAKLTRTVTGDFNQVVKRISDEVVNGSLSASMEDSTDFTHGDARCAVRVFERYSWAGGNRVSLSLTFFQSADSPIYISAITSGGSQAVFMKINTLGEEAFMDNLREIIDRLYPGC